MIVAYVTSISKISLECPSSLKVLQYWAWKVVFPTITTEMTGTGGTETC